MSKSGKSSKRSISKPELVVDLVAYIGTVLAVLFFNWHPKDLIWGLFITSLIFGYLTILVAIFAPAVRTGGKTGTGMAFVGLFMLAFFTFHFGSFHLIQFALLKKFVPLEESVTGIGGLLSLILMILGNYWPLILATIVSRYRDLPFDSEVFRADGRKDADAMAKGIEPFIKPYLNVARMQVTILLVVGLYHFEMGNLTIYPVLLFYFFPWSAFFGKKKAVK